LKLSIRPTIDGFQGPAWPRRDRLSELVRRGTRILKGRANSDICIT